MTHPDMARIVVLHVIYFAVKRSCPKYRQSNRGNEMCDNEMSRDHDAPVEYCENSLR